MTAEGGSEIEGVNGTRIFSVTVNGEYSITATAGGTTIVPVSITKIAPEVTLAYGLSEEGTWYESEEALLEAVAETTNRIETV